MAERAINTGQVNLETIVTTDLITRCNSIIEANPQLFEKFFDIHRSRRTNTITILVLSNGVVFAYYKSPSSDELWAHTPIISCGKLAINDLLPINSKKLCVTEKSNEGKSHGYAIAAISYNRAIGLTDTREFRNAQFGGDTFNYDYSHPVSYLALGAAFGMIGGSDLYGTDIDNTRVLISQSTRPTRRGRV